MKTILGLGTLLAILGLACGATTGSDGTEGSTNAAQSTSDPGGVCTSHECGTPEPGDCPLAKCADYQVACAYGRFIHVRCVPSPNRGMGSMPADQCELIGDCNNENLPLPEDGIPAGTRWADVPESWTCPDCAAKKDEFQMCEV